MNIDLDMILKGYVYALLSCSSVQFLLYSYLDIHTGVLVQNITSKLRELVFHSPSSEKQIGPIPW